MKKVISWAVVFIPLVLAGACYFLLPKFPYFTEYVISRGIFKIITVPVGAVTSLIPISLTELLVVAAVPLAVFLVVRFILAMKKSKARKKTALKAVKGVCLTVSCAALMYMLCHGANFYRLPLETLMELDTSPKTVDDLYKTCVILANGASDARAELEALDLAKEGEEFAFSENIFVELTRANNGYKIITQQCPYLSAPTFRQKPVLLSEAWSYTGIVGMYFPFFVENNVNIAQPDYSIPFTAAHESAHSRGIAQENECNFLAFWSCIHSEYPEYRYSGYMEALVYCSNELSRADSDKFRELQQYINSGMRADLSANNDYIDAHRSKVMEVSSSVNDTFISVQGVPEGIFSYDRVTELIVAACCSEEDGNYP